MLRKNSALRGSSCSFTTLTLVADELASSGPSSTRVPMHGRRWFRRRTGFASEQHLDWKRVRADDLAHLVDDVELGARVRAARGRGDVELLALDQLGDDRHVRVDVDAFHLARERVEAVVARARRRRDRSDLLTYYCGRRRRLLTNSNCFRDSALFSARFLLHRLHHQRGTKPSAWTSSPNRCRVSRSR